MSASPSFPSQSGHEPDTSILAVCPLCDMTFQPFASRVLGAREDAHLLFFECHRCGTGSLALVSAGPAGISTVGMMTDLTPTEVASWTDHQPISDDDVISVVEALNTDEHLAQTLQRI